MALAAAAFFTYGPIDRYYPDELLRLGFAESARRSFPAQNPLVWQGLLKYHYEADFFAAGISAETGIPLPIFYFRDFLLFNWTMLYFGLRGILRRAAPAATNLWAVGAFALLFLAHSHQIVHLTFRENSFALGLAVLGVSTLWTGLSLGDGGMLAAAAAAAGLVTFAKAPCGCLYTAFVWLAAFAYARSRRLNALPALATMLLSAISFGFAYRIFLTGGEVQGGHASMFILSLNAGTLQEFAPKLILNPRLLDSLAARGLDWGVAALNETENVLTLLRLGALPLLAAAATLLATRRTPGQATQERRLLLYAALGTFAVAAAMFCFVRYRISDSSDGYWVWFGLWFVAAAAYPLLAALPQAANLPRAFRAACVFFAVVAVGYCFRFWPIARSHKNVALEPWSSARQAACDALRQSPPGSIYLHNVLERQHWTMSGLCGRRAYVSYTQYGGVWENPDLYRRSMAEADDFYRGRTPDPAGWLRRNGIRYVLWDRDGSFPEAQATLRRYPFLQPIVDSGAVTLYEISNLAASGRN